MEPGAQCTVLSACSRFSSCLRCDAVIYGVSPVSEQRCASQVMCQPPCPGPSSQLGDVGEVGEVGEVGLVLPACLCSVRSGGRGITGPARSQLE